MAIEYEEIIQNLRSNHVTGIARYSNPNGKGKFKIYVTGKEEKIRFYAEQADIFSMQITPAENLHNKARQSRMAILEELRESRLKQVERLNGGGVV